MSFQSNSQNPETIQNLFNQIASRYDRTNALLSFNFHRLWNRQLIKEVRQKSPHRSLLDLCCGTGEIGFGLLKKERIPYKAYLLDFSEEMLHFARQKEKKLSLEKHEINYIQGDAQQIPLSENSVGGVTIAYGLRNVKEPLRCVEEAYRVLSPFGAFGILELTRPSSPLLCALHRFYLENCLPFVGRLLTSHQEAYEYLCRSIQAFMSPEEIVDLLEKSGFVRIRVLPLTGGIATLIIAEKPKVETESSQQSVQGFP